MASRTIAIRITIDNRDAINAAKAQAIAMRSVSDEANRQTQLQNGLTNSFLKGNLAARAISVGYGLVKSALESMAVSSIDFEQSMTKIAAITDANDTIMRSFEKTISSLSESTRLNQNELAKTALEMSKMGLSASQTELALDSVAKLSRALDEDLVKTGETVVSVINAYGLSADSAKKVTDELAFTVKASALSVESFSTAFSYVGGSAAAAGVSLTELQGAMDILSNSGIKASTIGTQLRRIINDLSNEHSKAAEILGGKTLASYGSLEKTLDALAQKHLSLSDLTALFGRTASSVATILIKYRGAMGDLATKTGDANGLVDQMSEKMNGTFKSSLQGVTSAWVQLGIEVSKSAGFMKSAVDQLALALRTLADREALANNVSRFKKDNFSAYYAVTQQSGTGLNAINENPIFHKWLELERQNENNALRVDNIIDELKNVLVRDKARLASAENDVNQVPIENTFLFKQLASLYAGAGHSKEEFLTKLGMARDKLINEISPRELGDVEDADILHHKKKKPRVPFSTFANLPNEDLYSMTDRNIGNDVQQDSIADNQLTSPLQKNNAWLFSPKNTNQLGSFASKLAEISLEFEKLDKLTENEKFIKAMSFELAQTGIRELANTIEGLSGLISKDLVESVLRGKDAFKGFGDALGDIFKKVIIDMTATIIKMLVFRAIASAISSAFPGSSSFFGAVSTTMFGGGEAVPKFASGTDQVVTRPTAFIAGESGMERVSVTPRAKMGSGGQGASIVVNIRGDVYGGEKFQEAVQMAQSKLRKKMV